MRRAAEQKERTEEEKSLSCQIPCLGGDCASPQEEREEEDGEGGMALKIMNARFAFLFVRGVSPSLPPFPRRLSLPWPCWRLKSDQLSLYFSLSMAPATTTKTTHRDVRNCDEQVALRC